MTDHPPMRWQRGSYNCIVSGEYTICWQRSADQMPVREPPPPKHLTSITMFDFVCYWQDQVIKEIYNNYDTDAAKQACADHARARE